MKKAFTLAEVLVTLGIIGVVAAMTMPNLMSNYQRQSYVTQLRKIHSELSQAVEAAMNDSNNSKIVNSQRSFVWIQIVYFTNCSIQIIGIEFTIKILINIL